MILLDASQHQMFRDAVAAHDSFVVTTHMNPDGDALGSQIAVTLYLRSLGKQVTMLNGDPTPPLLEFIEPEEGRVEIFDEARHTTLLAEVDALILVDNSAPDRFGRMESAIVAHADKTLCIDHHPTRQAPWRQNILQTEASATAAMVWELLRGAEWEPNLTACTAMFVGLATDTGFFRFNSTNAQAHRIAAEMIDRGVHPASIFRRIYERNSVAYTRLLGRTLDTLQLDAEGKIASAQIPRSTTVELGAEEIDTGEITSVLLSLDGIEIVLLFRELEAGRVKVSLRSKGRLDVHGLAFEFGGGGHRNASGIVMEAPLEEAVRRVLDRAREMLASASA